VIWTAAAAQDPVGTIAVSGYFWGMLKTKRDQRTTGLPVERLFTSRGQPIGKIVQDPETGRLRGFNVRGKPAGSFDPRTRKTTDARGQPFGVGNLLPALVMECRCPCLVGGKGRPIPVK
jgi:hypothetical protein